VRQEAESVNTGFSEPSTTLYTQ